MIAGSGPSAAYEELQGESGGTKEAEVTEAKDTVVMAVSTDPANVSPVSASTVDSCPITYNAYTRLLYVDGSDYVMEAAKSVEYEDDTHILVELRDDVYDELGNNMKASDVLFSMKLCLEGAGSNPTYLDSLDHVSVQEVPNYMLHGMMFNCSADSVFHSKEARQAVAYAVNKELPWKGWERNVFQPPRRISTITAISGRRKQKSWMIIMDIIWIRQRSWRRAQA